jgi:hypothetical protein
VERNSIAILTIHKKTPQTITQSKVVNVHNDDNHEHVQPFDEVIFVQQPWRFTTPSYNLPKIGASTPITTFVGFKTNHHIPTFIWYPLIWRWNDFTCSIGWSNFVMSTEDHLINQFLYHM